MAHELFSAPVIERKYSFKKANSEAIKPGEWQTWPVAKEMNTWNKAMGIKHALEIKGESSWSNVGRHQDRWKNEDGIISPEEAAFWLSLFTDERFLYDREFKYNETVYTEEWVKERCDVYTAEMFQKEEIDGKLIERLFAVTYQGARGAARFLRALLPYEKGLRLILSHANAYNLDQWIPPFGPPPKEARAQAEEAIDDYFEGDLDTSSMNFYSLQNLLSNTMRTIPSQKSIIAVLDLFLNCPPQGRMWNSSVADCFYHHPDDEKILALLNAHGTAKRDHDIRSFLQYFGFEHIDLFFEKVVDLSNKNSSYRDEQVQVLSKVDMPELVEPFYKLSGKAEFNKHISPFLLRDNASQTAGLLAMCERRGKKRQWALDYLERRLASLEGEKERVEALKPLCAKSVQKLIDEELFAEAESMPELPKKEWTPWMKTFESKETGAKETLGDFFASLRPELLPPVVTPDGEHAFPLAVLLGILKAQKISTTSKNLKSFKNKSLENMSKVLDERSFEVFVLELFNFWHDNNGKKETLWFLPLLEAFGGALTISALSNYIREAKGWREIGAHRPARELCLNSLATMKTSGAIRQIDDCAHHSSDENLRSSAKRLLITFKGNAALSDEEYQDFIVPDFGLNEHGKRTFDYGPRQVTMVVHGRSDILFESTEGKTYTNIPPIRQSDERRLAVAAKEQYKLISKPLREVLSAQNRRFEDAMLTQRFWRFDVWERSVGGHALLAHIARRIVWSVYDEKDNFVECIIADEDGSFVNLEMDDVELLPSHKLTPTHPLDLDEPTRQAWLEQLVDFEIIQPFEQMTRTLYTPDSDTLKQLKKAYKETNLFDPSVMFQRRSRGWQLINPQNSSSSSTFELQRQIEGQSLKLHLVGSYTFTRRDHTKLLYTPYNTAIAIIHLNGDEWKPTKKDAAKMSPVLFSELMTFLHNALHSNMSLS